MNNTPSMSSQRLARLRAGLAAQDLDGILISHLPNVRYLTGFSGSNGWLLLGSDWAVFGTDGRYEEQAAVELAPDAGLELLVSRDGLLGDLAERAARAFAGARVGFEARHVVYADWQKLAEADAVEWTAAKGLVEELRAVKSEDEVAAIRRAVDIAASALSETLSLVKRGVTEKEVAAELDFRMTRLGAEGPAFETIVASGERTALPHAATGDRRIRQGDLLLCDFGARLNGYCSDLTRTFAIGRPDARQVEVYELVLAAYRRACGELRQGVTGRDVDAAAREVFEAQDLESKFAHSTGHGLGLEVHEGPRLSRQSEEELVANMVVTVEPGLYFPGWGGVRIENDLLVTLDQPMSLTDLEYDQLLSLSP